jgi:hypothetical protein
MPSIFYISVENPGMGSMPSFGWKPVAGSWQLLS